MNNYFVIFTLMIGWMTFSIPECTAQEVEVLGALKIVDGSQGTDKVLTSDATGLATWKDPSIPVVNVQTDNVSIATSQTWVLGPTFNTITGFKGGSKLKIYYHVSTRNLSTIGYGGAYIEPQISFDEGATWQSLGSCGIDGGVAQLSTGGIGSYNNTLIIDPGLATAFSVKMRLYYKTFIGAANVNGGMAINDMSGTAPLISGTENSNQHFTHVIVEEIFQ